MQTLRRLGAERADRDRILAALRVMAERAETSPEPEYRAYLQRLADYNCAFAAQVHNATHAGAAQAGTREAEGLGRRRAFADGGAQPVYCGFATVTTTRRGLMPSRGKSVSAASNIALMAVLSA